MPLEVTNRTGYTIMQIPMVAKNGANIMQTIVKAAFDIGLDGRLASASTHPAIQLDDEYWGEAGKSALRRESDVALGKPYTDLLVLGYAWAPHGRPTAHVDVGLAYAGQVLKRLRVSGDRFWWDKGLGWRLSAPQPFERLPLSYELAYGGMDEAGSEARNRVGRGYASGLLRNHLLREQGCLAPNIEHVHELITSPEQRPNPAGVGVVSRDWMPRIAFAGTYDDAWLEDVFPLLPDDFDPRFCQSADPAQWLPEVRGGERVVLVGMRPEGELSFELPNPVLHIGFFYRKKRCERLHMHLETMLVDTEARRLELTWKAVADVHGDPFQLEETIVSREPPSQAELRDCGC